MVLIAPSGKLHVASSTGAMPLARSTKLLRAISVAVPAPAPRKRSKVSTPSQDCSTEAFGVDGQVAAASARLVQPMPTRWRGEETFAEGAVEQPASTIESGPMDLPFQQTQESPLIAAKTEASTTTTPFAIEQLPFDFEEDPSNDFWS